MAHESSFTPPPEFWAKFEEAKASDARLESAGRELLREIIEEQDRQLCSLVEQEPDS